MLLNKQKRKVDCVFKKLLDPRPESWTAYVYKSWIWGGWELVPVQLVVIPIASNCSNPDLDIVPESSGCDRSSALSGIPIYCLLRLQVEKYKP